MKTAPGITLGAVIIKKLKNPYPKPFFRVSIPLNLVGVSSLRVKKDEGIYVVCWIEFIPTSTKVCIIP